MSLEILVQSLGPTLTCSWVNRKCVKQVHVSHSLSYVFKFILILIILQKACILEKYPELVDEYKQKKASFPVMCFDHLWDTLRVKEEKPKGGRRSDSPVAPDGTQSNPLYFQNKVS